MTSTDAKFATGPIALQFAPGVVKDKGVIKFRKVGSSHSDLANPGWGGASRPSPEVRRYSRPAAHLHRPARRARADRGRRSWACSLA